MTVGFFPFLPRPFRRSGRAKAATTVASTHDDPGQRRRMSRGNVRRLISMISLMNNWSRP
jgi:hypothetical protein